jgi:hypothetical protein
MEYYFHFIINVFSQKIRIKNVVPFIDLIPKSTPDNVEFVK